MSGAALFDALIDAVAERVLARLTKDGILQPRLLSVPAAAMYLGRTEEAVRRLQASGTLRAVKLDGRVQFDRVDLDTFIENRKIT